jgi:hypothetical protein
VKATCNCGAVELEISADPIAQIHCHCKDCQKAHGAAYVSSAIFPASSVSVESGELVPFVLKATKRLRCSSCGMHMFSEIEQVGLRSVNAYALPEGTFQPQLHVQCKDAVHPISDELPHFKAFPASFGGVDELVDW